VAAGPAALERATGIELEPDLVPATVALAPMAGWTAHVLEQAVANRLIRPDARYEGPVERDVSA
jgi:citrate synthase